MFDHDYWITFLSAILSVYIYVLIFKRLSKYNLSIQKTDYFYEICCALLIATNNLYNIVFFRVLMTAFITVLLFKIIFKEDNSNIVYYGLFIFIFTLILDVILSVFLSIFFNNLSGFNDVYIYKFIYTIVFDYLLYFILKNKKIQFFIQKTKSIIKIHYTFLFYLFFLIFFINIMFTLFTFDIQDYKFYFLLIFFFITLLVINYLFYNSFYNNKVLKIKNECLENNLLNYKKSMDDYRILKHNYFNDLLAVKSAPVKEKDEIIEQIIIKYDKDSTWVNYIKDLPYGIQGVLYLKNSIATSLGIKLIVNNSFDQNIFDNNSQLYLALCNTFSIILDNAIEASNKSDNKNIIINFIEKANENIIEVINEFVNFIDLDEIGNKNYSTKSRDSGLGLFYINKLNNNINVRKKIINNLFIIIIAIKK